MSEQPFTPSITHTSDPRFDVTDSLVSKISAVISETSNFVLDKYVRNAEIDLCIRDHNYPDRVDQCVCVLAGAPTYHSCIQGFRQVRQEFSSLHSHPFPPLDWCMAHVPLNEKNQPISEPERNSWMIGCVNGIR